MRKVLVISFCLLFALSSIALARQAPKGTVEKRMTVEKPSLLDMDRPLDEQGMFSAAQAGTTWLLPPNSGVYTWDSGPSCILEGWTSHDITEQVGCYWHVADATELNGGDYGGLIVLSGLQSLWIGQSPDSNDPILCGYAALPGYGNAWDMGWCFKCIEVPDTEEVYISYDAIWDSEPGYDYTFVEYCAKSTCDSLNSIDIIPGTDWLELAAYDGVGGPGSFIDTIPAGHAGSIKIRFHFVSDGAWSDQDGLWNTDGALIVDNVSVDAEVSGNYDFENFEDEAAGDTQTLDGDWECCVLTGYGDLAGLYPGLVTLQEDPCRVELSCLWAFINGTDNVYTCGGHPEQDAVPFVNGKGQYVNTEIWSPQADWTGTGSVVNIEFDVYRDLAIPDLLFYIWHVRSIDATGCPGVWKDENFVYYGANKDWQRSLFPVGHFISGTADKVQFALGAVDMCPFWCDVYGPGDCHSHAPLIDNAEMYRVAVSGPQWSVRDIDLFNDTFPTNGTSVGTGRIDMANDRLPSANPAILPGDSAVVKVSDPESGLGTDTYTGFGAAVYMYVTMDPAGPYAGAGALAGAETDNFRWPYVDSYLHNGDWVHVFRCDTSFAQQNRGGPVPDGFCIDLNDNYFVNGDTLNFWFGAQNSIGAYSYWSQGSGITANFDEAYSAPMEMQILPGEGVENGGDILYVDNFSGRGGQNYFDSAFQLLGIYEQIDRFDKRGPSSLVGNALGYHATTTQLWDNYRKILWNAGDLSAGTVEDGVDDKADSYTLLYTFLDLHPNANGCGIYFSADDLAEELNGMTTASSQQFKNVYMPHALVTGDVGSLAGHGISPKGIGVPTGVGTPPAVGIFDHGAPFGVDTVVVYGGCPIINDFDVFTPVGNATAEMLYDNDVNAPAITAYSVANSNGNTARTVLSGFSFHYLRDDVPSGIPDRADHLRDIIIYLGNALDEPTGVTPGSGFKNSLTQNYPNPFNPNTTIKYSVKNNAHVSLKIYNVAGQLVRTLVNSDMNAGAYTETWNGRSNTGNSVSSGVYFYKLVTKDFSMTKKMVLLK